MARPSALLSLAAAALLFPAAARAGELGLGPGPDIIVSWTAPDAAGNITFTTTCFPHAGEGDIAWCSWGVGATASMAPANVFWLAVSAADVPFAVEDRAITAFAQPPCIKEQLTHTTAKAFNKTSGALSATFTRPAKVSAALQKQGYISFVDALQHVIGAIGAKTRPAKKCDVTQAEHYGAFTYVSVNFFNA